MKKIKNEKSLIKQNSKIAIAVTMLAFPMLYSPSTIFAQNGLITGATVTVYELSKLKRTGPDGEFSIAGSDNNKHVIYKNKKGDLCWMDANNGNLNFLPKDFKFTHYVDKFSTNVWLLGVDKTGIIIYKDALGNKFSLDPNNGNKIPVK